MIVLVISYLKEEVSNVHLKSTRLEPFVHNEQIMGEISMSLTFCLNDVTFSSLHVILNILPPALLNLVVHNATTDIPFIH